jgi:hypothetical protein
MTRSIAAAVILLSGFAAHALAPSGTCSGAMQGMATLAVADAPGGTFLTVAPSAVPSLFGAAECQCDTTDVNLELRLTQPLPVIAATAEVWVGDSSCELVTTRTSTSNTGCERIASLSAADLTAAGGGVVHVPLPSRALFSPLRHRCDEQPQAGNQSSSSSSPIRRTRWRRATCC